MSQPSRRRRFIPGFEFMPVRLTPSGNSPMDPVMPSDSTPPTPILNSPMDPTMPSDSSNSGANTTSSN